MEILDIIEKQWSRFTIVNVDTIDNIAYHDFIQYQNEK
jgi:hypothetical protein